MSDPGHVESVKKPDLTGCHVLWQSLLKITGPYYCTVHRYEEWNQARVRV